WGVAGGVRRQSGFEDVGRVGGPDEDDALPVAEPVHLDEQLIESLFALVVAAAQAGAALAADRGDLIAEDDARAVLLGLLEQVAHPGGADADEHLDEVGTRNREERNPRLTRDSAGQQRLTTA